MTERIYSENQLQFFEKKRPGVTVPHDTVNNLVSDIRALESEILRLCKQLVIARRINESKLCEASRVVRRRYVDEGRELADVSETRRMFDIARCYNASLPAPNDVEALKKDVRLEPLDVPADQHPKDVESWVRASEFTPDVPNKILCAYWEDPHWRYMILIYLHGRWIDRNTGASYNTPKYWKTSRHLNEHFYSRL